MKIFCFRKKHLLGLSISLMILVFIFCCYQKPFSFALSFSSDSFLAEKVQQELSHLTTSEEKIAYLTFDDGPTLKATGKILDCLQEEDIKATFFVIGKYVNHHPDLVKRAYEEGHYIANHGYDHNNKKLYESEQSFIAEITQTDLEIGKAVGIENYCSHIFRFPNGFMSPNYKSQKKKAAEILSDLGYLYVDWNCLNRDSEKKYSRYQLLENLKKSSKNKGTLIILMHDTSDVNDTPSILKDSISYLKSQGYEFRNFYDFVSQSELSH